MRIFGAAISLENNETKNYEFFKSLLKYSSFDAFHLFFPSPNHAQRAINKLIADNSISNSQKAKIEILLNITLTEKLQYTNYQCFYSEDENQTKTLTHLRDKYAKKMFPITGLSRFGYDASLDTQLSRTQAKELMNFALDTKYILYLGRISPSTKGDLYPLLLVFKSLKDRIASKIKLILAGNVNPMELPIHKDMIIELGLGNDVQLMINFDETKKKALISAAELCVMPSDSIIQTFGTTITEAAACGCPVVASDIAPYRDLIVQNETGFKVKTTRIDDFAPCEMADLYDSSVFYTMLGQALVVDCDDLEDKIYLLLTDEKLRDKMSETAAVFAKQNFSWEAIIKKYEAITEDIIAEQHKNNYLQDFSHFPTQVFNENLILELTTDGENVVNRKKEIPPAYSDCSIMIDVKYLREVLNFLYKRGSMTAKNIFIRFPDEQTRGRFTLIWAAKYRLIRFKEKLKKW